MCVREIQGERERDIEKETEVYILDQKLFFIRRVKGREGLVWRHTTHATSDQQILCNLTQGLQKSFGLKN